MQDDNINNNNNNNRMVLNMNGTALLIQEDHTVKVLENVKEQQFDMLKEEKETKDTVSFIYHEDVIDWEYGY